MKVRKSLSRNSLLIIEQSENICNFIGLSTILNPLEKLNIMPMSKLSSSSGDAKIECLFIFHLFQKLNFYLKT